MHLCQVEVVAYRPLVHRHLPRIWEEEVVVVAVAAAVRQMYPKVVAVAVVEAAGVRQIYPEEGVVAVAVAVEGHHHPCSLEEVEVGEGVRAG